MQSFVIIFITCRLGYLWAAVRFCRKYLGISRVKEVLWLVLLLGGGLLCSALHGHFADSPNILFALGQHVMLLGSVLLLFRGWVERKFLLGSILTAITTLTENFFVSLAACLLLIWKHVWLYIPVPFIEVNEERLIVCGMQIAEMLAVYWLSRRQISFIEQENPALIRGCQTNDFGSRKGYAVLAIPLLAVTLLIDVANWGASHGVLVRSGGNFGLYYDQIFSHAEFLILTALSMSVVGFYLFGLERIYLEQRRSGQYHAQIAVYQMLEEQYGQAERLRHDMKNHVIDLSGLLENREWGRMAEYLDNMQDSGGFGAAEEATGNSAVDALLYQKRQTAKSRQIRWMCDVRIPKPCRIHEFDLCILFGNVLDNAVEACERIECGGGVQHGRNEDDSEVKRFIDMQARAVKRCFLLEVRNSASPETAYRNGKVSQFGRRAADESVMQGRKEERHGIGLMNIADVVKRYDGVMNTQLQDGVFTISVLLPLGEDFPKPRM